MPIFGKMQTLHRKRCPFRRLYAKLARWVPRHRDRKAISKIAAQTTRLSVPKITWKLYCTSVCCGFAGSIDTMSKCKENIRKIINNGISVDSST